MGSCKIKTCFKVFTVLSAAVAVPILINKYIFDKSKEKRESRLREKYYDWTYGKIKYNVVGKGKPLLLVHDILPGSSSAEWEKNITVLADYYKVYAVDLLGFGFSDKSNVTFSSYLYSKLMSDFVKDVIGTKTDVIASNNSAGFVLGAFNMNESDDLFNKMVLISPCPDGTCKIMPELLPERDCKWVKRILEMPVLGTAIYNLFTSKYYLERFFATEILSDSCSADTVKALACKYNYFAHHGGVNSKLPIASFVGRHLSVDTQHLMKDERLNNRVMLAWGDENDFNCVSNLQKLLDINSTLESKVYSGAKVMPHYDNFEQFNLDCLTFLDK